MKCSFIGFKVIESKKGDIFYKLFFTKDISKKDKGYGQECFDEFTSHDFCNYDDCLFPCDVDVEYSKGFDGKATVEDITLL